MTKNKPAAKKTMAERWVGRYVTTGFGMMTPAQARTHYGTVSSVDEVKKTVTIACEDGQSRTWPVSSVSKVAR